jgi:hypothetical protein
MTESKVMDELRETSLRRFELNGIGRFFGRNDRKSDRLAKFRPITACLLNIFGSPTLSDPLDFF